METWKFQNRSFFVINIRRRYIVEILPILLETLNNQSINRSLREYLFIQSFNLLIQQEGTNKMYLGYILKHGNTMIFGRLVKGTHNIIRVYVVLYYYRYYAHSECHHRFFLLNSLTPQLISTELVGCISTNQKWILNHISNAFLFMCGTSRKRSEADHDFPRWRNI